ncbi:methionine gamma-lyase [Sphingorhabdus lutea]|uniref:L-methionine gamma-lyase n=2 Tax=Sphingorhabdus lutea TaxID=1913578 RepID=A0A1L3JEW4_9SPHN|nr:methionine gamma-lyase [Sphingorhabdus lutea]
MGHHPAQQQAFSTRAIHSGYNPMDEQGALCPPLHLTSTFVAESADDMGAMFAGEKQGHFYTRISNPTLDLLERRIADLENAEAALGTASGMGAISATLWTLVAPGDEIIVDMTLYGCTFAFMRHGLGKFGVKVRHVDLTKTSLLQDAINDKTKVVYFETPANPNMRIVDIAAISEIAHQSGAYVVVDNTYATPYLTRPIDFGADIVVHSATKYLGGHGDLVAGIVAGSKELLTQIRLVGLKDMTGAVMSPFNAMLIMRGLKTLELRMDRHCQSAMKIAAWMESQSMVDVVHYPGLKSSPYHDLASRQMDGFGGMIAFELKGGINAGKAFIDALNLIHCAVSLGDAESLIQHPASMTHSPYTPEERAEYGISDGLVRLSIGLESVDDLMADLAQAFAALEHVTA